MSPIPALAALALALVVAPSAVAQEPAPPPAADATPPFGETIEVRLVNVEVVVTDEDGRRVEGLGADDFQLFVDGRAAEVAFFTEVRDGVLHAEAGVPVPPAAAAEPGDAAASGDVVGTSYLVFLDSFFMQVQYRSFVLRQLADEVGELLRPADRMAVVDFDGRNLAMLSEWTSDVDALRELLLAASDVNASLAWAGFGVDAEGDVRFPPSNLHGVGRQERLRMPYRAAEAALAVGHALRDVPGRKVLLLVSGGWPIKGSVMGSLATYGEELLDYFTDAANLLGFTIYPFHTASRGTGNSGAGVNMGGLPYGARASRAGKAGPFEATQPSLLTLAEATGGRLSGLAHEPLGAVVADTRSYYWLGFYHDAGGDDRARAVRVEVARPGLEVRSRESFLPLSRSKVAALEARTALWTGHQEGAAPLSVRVGEPRLAGLGAWEVPVTVDLPIDQVTFLPLDGESVATLELRVVGQTLSGDTLDWKPVTLRLRSEAEPVRQESQPYTFNLRVRHKKQDLRVALYDLQGDRAFATGLRLGEPD